MHDSISTVGSQRPRVRRGLGVVVGAALLVTPLATAPVASAEGALGNVTAGGIAAAIAQLPIVGGDIVRGLGHTVGHLTGESAPNSVRQPCGTGLGAGLACVVQAITPGQQAKATIKANRKRGQLRLRAVK